MRAIRRLSLFACVLAFPFVASALTVMSRGDLRRWETVTDRSRPLSWPWEADSESATLTFSNRLTQSVSSLTVVREPCALRGSCPHPVPASADDALVAATLEQWAGGVAISRETAELAYVSGASGRAITVRTKADRNWYRVERPCVAAFDAGWWNVAGPTGYEVLWRTPTGQHLVERRFEGAGLVDDVVLRFGIRRFLVMIR